VTCSASPVSVECRPWPDDWASANFRGRLPPPRVTKALSIKLFVHVFVDRVHDWGGRDRIPPGAPWPLFASDLISGAALRTRSDLPRLLTRVRGRGPWGADGPGDCANKGEESKTSLREYSGLCTGGEGASARGDPVGGDGDRRPVGVGGGSALAAPAALLCGPCRRVLGLRLDDRLTWARSGFPDGDGRKLPLLH